MAGSFGGGLGRRRGGVPISSDINVTSLVDVAFVLLIIFMITAPMLQGGVDVQLPRAEARPLKAEEGLVVTVDRSGRIFLDQTPVSYTDFRVAFQAVVADAGAEIARLVRDGVQLADLEVRPATLQEALDRLGGVAR